MIQLQQVFFFWCTFRFIGHVNSQNCGVRLKKIRSIWGKNTYNTQKSLTFWQRRNWPFFTYYQRYGIMSCQLCQIYMLIYRTYKFQRIDMVSSRWILAASKLMYTSDCTRSVKNKRAAALYINTIIIWRYLLVHFDWYKIKTNWKCKCFNKQQLQF